HLGVHMKYGAAVVAGALVMFASGYMLGYTTAFPDVLRAASLELDDMDQIPAVEDIESMLEAELEGPTATDPEPGSGESEEQFVAAEMEYLKRMIVPLLTDDEIKRIREDIAKSAEPDGRPQTTP